MGNERNPAPSKGSSVESWTIDAS